MSAASPNESDSAPAGTLGDDSMGSILRRVAAAPAVALDPEGEAAGLLQAGERIANRFVVRRRLGAGGMGVVYLAFDERLDREVALKLHTAKNKDRGLERLMREAKALARLDHPNVIIVYDVGTFEQPADEGGGPGLFIAMEYLDGGNAREWLAEDREWIDVLNLFVNAGHGLVAAHEAGLVHRDFKPENVLLGSDGRVRVADFGLARATGSSDSLSTTGSQSAGTATAASLLGDQLTKTGAAVGTPAYMAPEQRQGSQVDARADQFAFCVAVYEGLYGMRPFRSSKEAPRPPSPNSRVPRWVWPVLHRGLARFPDDRYPDLESLIDALRSPMIKPRWRRLSIAAFGIATLAGAVGFGLAQDRTPICGGLEDKLAPTWSEERADRVRAAFATIDGGPRAWSSVAPHLEAYAQTWLELRTQACEATHIEHTQSEELLDQQVVCFDRRLRSLDALVDTLEEATPEVVRNAAPAAISLPSLHPCSDAAFVAAQVRPPEDPALAREVADLDDRLAHAVALEQTGRIDEAVSEIELLAKEAERAGHAPTHAEVLLRLGRILMVVSRHQEAEEALERAYFIATQADYDWVSAQAATNLAFDVGYSQGRFEEGRKWAEHAFAEARQEGMEPMCEASAHSAAGVIAQAEGHYQESYEHFDRALQIVKGIPGLELHNLGQSYSDRGTALDLLGRPQEAIADYEEALAIHEELFGRDNLWVSTILTNLGLVLDGLGRSDEALEAHREAVAISQALLGEDHYETAINRLNLAISLYGAGEVEASIDMLDSVLPIVEQSMGRTHYDVGLVLFARGTAARDVGRLGLALNDFGRAKTIHAEALGDDHVETRKARAMWLETKYQQAVARDEPPEDVDAAYEAAADACVAFSADSPCKDLAPPGG